MMRSYLVLCCLVIWVILATGTLPSNALSPCCAITYKCQLRSDCPCVRRQIQCRDPVKGTLNSGKRSPPTDRQANPLESSGFYGDPRMRASLFRRALQLANMNDGVL